MRLTDLNTRAVNAASDLIITAHANLRSNTGIWASSEWRTLLHRCNGLGIEGVAQAKILEAAELIGPQRVGQALPRVILPVDEEDLEDLVERLRAALSGANLPRAEG